MKKRVGFTKAEKAITFLLLIVTLFAAVIVVKGALLVNDTQHQLQHGLQATEQFLKETEEAPAVPDKPHQTSTEKVGGAILSVFSPKEKKLAMYDGLTVHHLQMGVARASESALPGEVGNCVVYGHRDSAFRCLKTIQAGHKVVIRTKQHAFVYFVERTQICSPESAEITQPYTDAYLTLVTCYPFVYSGAAQKRFIAVCKLDSINAL